MSAANQTPAPRKVAMSATLTPEALDLEAMLAEMTATLPAAEPKTQQDVLREKRSRATKANRIVKQEAHDAILASVEGDREKLKTISVWVPRTSKRKMFARAFDRIEFAKGGEKFIDMEAETEEVEYDLTEIEVERAKHPKEEVEFAKLQGRFIAHAPSIQGFFAAPATVRYAARPNDNYAPLGDFEWADRSEALSRASNKARAQRPIRNIKEAV